MGNLISFLIGMVLGYVAVAVAGITIFAGILFILGVILATLVGNFIEDLTR